MPPAPLPSCCDLPSLILLSKYVASRFPSSQVTIGHVSYATQLIVHHYPSSTAILCLTPLIFQMHINTHTHYSPVPFPPSFSYVCMVLQDPSLGSERTVFIFPFFFFVGSSFELLYYINSHLNHLHTHTPFVLLLSGYFVVSQSVSQCIRVLFSSPVLSSCTSLSVT